MVLNREYRQLLVSKSFDGVVIEVNVRNLQVGRSWDTLLGARDCETVVLRRDQNAPGGDFLHWVIPAPVAVGHLHRFRAERQT